MKPLRIVFMGTPDFALPSLQALLASDEELLAVVTQPDRPRGRGRKLRPPPVKELALSHHLPVIQPPRVREPEFIEQLRELAPDLIAVTAFGQLIPPAILGLPACGIINVHGSLLPRYRGAAPIQWTLLNGDREAGITIMQMDEGMDTGNIITSTAIPVDSEETAGSLAEKLAGLGGKLLVETIKKLHSGPLPSFPQDDALASPAPPLRKEQGVIDWQKPAHEISCLIRGLDPWPTATTRLNDRRLRLFKPRVIQYQARETPGTICRINQEGLLVACGQDSLLAAEIQLEGTRRMEVTDFIRGRSLPTGTILG